jgi:hypothetical protein
MLDEQVLQDMYEGGTAYYFIPGKEECDMFAAIRYVSKVGQFRYAPLLVHVKSIKESIKTRIEKGLQDMSNIIKKGTGLCLFVRLGADTDEKTSKSLKLEASDIDGFGEDVISRLLVIPNDDEFGVTNAFVSVTADNEEISELLTSHRAIASHASSVNGAKLNMSLALRSTGRQKNEAKDRPLQFLLSFAKSIFNSDE